MKTWNVKHKFLKAIYNYLLFFLLVAFLVTCTTMLFVSTLSATLNIELTEQNVNVAAKLTFLNVIFLSVLFSVIDALRRKFTTDRITGRIAEAAKKVVQGDFTVRIDTINHFSADEKFNEIIA